MLLGSSLFIVSCVTASVLFSSPKQIKLNKWFFIRDTFFLLVAHVMLIYAILYRQSIDMPMSIAFVVVYGVYVVFVIVQDTLFRNKSE